MAANSVAVVKVKEANGNTDDLDRMQIEPQHDHSNKLKIIRRRLHVASVVIVVVGLVAMIGIIIRHTGEGYYDFKILR